MAGGLVANRRRRFDQPIPLWDCTVIRTLADARRWLIDTDSDRNKPHPMRVICAPDFGWIRPCQHT